MTPKISPLILLPALICIALISGCTSSPSSGGNSSAQTAGPSAYPLTVADDMGRIMTFAAPPQRIVSLSPSNTEILYALGLGDRVVGVDCYSNYPPEAMSKPSMGGMVNVSVDKVAAAKPDLVLVSQFTPAETVDQLAAKGINVYSTHPDNASGADLAVLEIGQICGVNATALQLYDKMKEDVGAVTEQTSRLDAGRNPTVLMIITLGNESYVADQNGYMGDLITIGGGRNVATGPVMTPREIAQANPDVIIVPLTGWTIDTYNSLTNASEPWMRDLKAVQDGKVLAVDYDIVGRPGPRAGDAALDMAEAIHPEIFGPPAQSAADIAAGQGAVKCS